MTENMNATTVLDRSIIKPGAELLIPARGNKTLAVRITSRASAITFSEAQSGAVYVGFMAYRIRKAAEKIERSSFGHQRFYFVRLADVTPF